MVCDVCSVTWMVTWLYAVRRGLAGRQCRWNVEVQPVSVRTSMTRRRAADTAPCPTCAGRSCSVWACRPRPTATSTVSSNDLCCSSQSCCCCYLFVYLDVLRTHTYNHVDMFFHTIHHRPTTDCVQIVFVSFAHQWLSWYFADRFTCVVALAWQINNVIDCWEMNWRSFIAELAIYSHLDRKQYSCRNVVQMGKWCTVINVSN